MKSSTCSATLAALVVFSFGGPRFVAQARALCFQPVQPLLSVQCTVPAQIDTVIPRLAFSPRLPDAHSSLIPRSLLLTRVVTATTESPNGGRGTTYALFLVFGTVPQGRRGAIVPSSTRTRYLVVAEVLAHPAGARLLVTRTAGELALFRMRTSQHALPWTATAPIPGRQVEVVVTTNLQRQDAVRVARSLTSGMSR